MLKLLLMQIAIFNSELLWTPHFGAGLEIIENHLLKGDRVSAFVCNAFLQQCDQNLQGKAFVCDLCCSKRAMGHKALSASIQEIPVQFEKKNYASFRASMSIDEVKEIRHQNYDVGMAAISSVVSRVRDAYLSIPDHARVLEPLINNAIGLYEFFIQQLRDIRPERVYIFNGRLLCDKALM